MNVSEVFRGFTVSLYIFPAYQDDDDELDPDDQESLPEFANSYYPPPDYATAMCEEVDSGQLETGDDTDDCVEGGAGGVTVALHLSTSPPGSSDSTASNLSSHVLLSQDEDSRSNK